jgi:phosphocarrier protein NPr/phosphocarrier protein
MQGLHARPAHAVASLASRFESKIEIIRDSESVDATSILSILMLGAPKGVQLTIRATGRDAGEAIDALSDLFARGFSDNGEQAKTENRTTEESEKDGEPCP